MITGARAIAEMLDGYGVTHLFHVPAVLRRTMVELEKHTSIKRLRPHGEASAAYMADGYARASGRPGLCAAQVVGAHNLAAGLRDAYLAHSPVIALTGGRDPHTKFRKVYQEVDDVPAFETVTKLNATIDSVERIPDMLRQAFRVATSGSPGPVHLQFAGNEGQLDADEAEMDLRCETRYASVPPFRPIAPDSDLTEALDLLGKAERPVIVAGGGVRASGGGEALVSLAEKLSIPVATSLNGKDVIPGTHPLSVGVAGTYSRGSANRVVLDADLVFFIGSETGGMTTHFWKVPPLGQMSSSSTSTPRRAAETTHQSWRSTATPGPRCSGCSSLWICPVVTRHGPRSRQAMSTNGVSSMPPCSNRSRCRCGPSVSARN